MHNERMNLDLGESRTCGLTSYSIPVGPTHPALKEPIRFSFDVEGERIVGVDIQPGFAHRGIEYMGMRRNLIQTLYLSERICGICSISHPLTLVQAVEAAAGIEVPPRAQAIRTIIGEVERIHSHLLWAGVGAHELGFDTLLYLTWNVREKVMDLLEQLTGNRVDYAIPIYGGVRRDIPEEKAHLAYEAIEYYNGVLQQLIDAFLHDKSVEMRTRNVGVMTYDQAIVDLPIPRLAEIGQEIVDLFLQIEPDARLNVELERGVQRLSLRNQAGTEVSFQRSPLSMAFEVSRVKGDDVLLMFDVMGTTVWDEDYIAFARRLGEKLELAIKSAAIRSGRMPVLFAPTGALVLGLPLMYGFNGKSVYTGISPMKGKIGQKLFDEKLTIVDDGTLDGRFNSAPYDDEGVPRQRTVLVENGVLKGFLYDLKTAAQTGAKSTGNGSRGLLSQPRPSPTNLIFQADKTPLKEIIAGIDEGLLVEGVLGLGQGNVVSGAFSNPVMLAFKIEKGEIVGRVKDVSIAGNVYELLQNVEAVSQETQWVFTRLNLPSILLTDMNVVAKA